MNPKAVRGWVLYDWANSAFVTTMVAAVLPIYYKDVAAKDLPGNTADAYWGYSQSAAMLIVALLAPLLGAVADLSGRKALFLRWFSFLGIAASGCFAFVGTGDYVLASALLILSTVGYTGGNTFYDALLPDLVEAKDRDRISSRGYAIGYTGGGLLLTINLAMMLKPEFFGFPDTQTATRAAFVTVALWWFVFSLPLFKHVRDARHPVSRTWAQYGQEGFGRIGRTLRQLKHYPELVKYMIAFWFFNDGINTIISMATIYGRGIGIDRNDLITALVITQFVGIPCTYLFGKIADRFGSKNSLYVSLGIYVLIVILGYNMASSFHFYLLAGTVGLVQGGSQAIARSIYSRMVPKSQSAEFFGFLSVSSKFSAMVGPFVFALTAQVTGSSRLAILSLLLFFIVGIGLLTRVNIAKGEAEADQHVPVVPPGRDQTLLM
ncbi:MFS transporter [Paenibacillus gansuensis]|uniref:MFS transporter n=1 Tax=Paenibacillus gansuensis TaxID=306542 RepID=A0ABW5P796_9BACL